MKSNTRDSAVYLYKPPRTKIKYQILVFLLAFSVFLFSCGVKAPVITSIDPKIGRMGEIITLTGSNFGASRDESYVTIAGISPTNSAYHLWQDNIIILKVPELGESGLVYVRAKGKKSNGVLFSNSASVPRPVDGEELGLDPKIASVTPQIGAPGTLITVTGNNFGISRENAAVFFSWDYESGAFNPYAVREPEFIEVSETEMGYEYWSAREIRIRLPDGAVSGNLEIKTPHGRSRNVFFDVSGKPGFKNIKDKRNYTITYSVDIRVTEASRPNTLYLWIPKPVISPSQRNVVLVSRNIEPFMENHKGVSLYKLDSLGTSSNQSVNLSYRVEVYAVESGIRPSSIKQESTSLSKLHTQSTNLIPSDNQQIRAAINSILGREQNPYLKAKIIYDWIIKNINISDSASYNDLIDALVQRQGDPYSAALLYTAMTRAAGVPCIPVAGVLINQNGQTFRHYWAEFWIDGFGWIPVDPAMGAGAVQLTDGANPRIDGETVTGQDLANFYFGNLDNQRIAFSRGELVLSQIESRGRLVSRPQSYSLQNVWEESVGGLESYSSLWGDIIISGIYVQ
ncbi:MAG: IPT/TIG domain-containing protein [Treponema sp.]|jgi:transglutaminase-like putative cysteine protease|nr:IPT/TIG domain-containing protein [Treponema sp.]